MAFEVNSVPWSETITPGLPRRAITAVSSRATRRPEIDVSGIAAKHSRVTVVDDVEDAKATPCMRAARGRGFSCRPSRQHCHEVGECRASTARAHYAQNWHPV